MGRHKRKQFIDKKNAVTFHLVHRSQRDPLQADEESSRYVLQEALNPNEKKPSHEERKEEQQKYGIFFEDDYDYTQHLREVKTENVLFAVPEQYHKQRSQADIQLKGDDVSQPKLQLPSDVFASSREEDIGLLNKAAPISGPRFDLDPDVVAAMDDDFDLDDPDNILDDDFVLKAQDMAPIGEEEDRYEMSDGYDYSDDDGNYENVSSGGEFDREDFDDEKEETKSRFTNYSLSSSVIRRNEGLTLLDDRFEKIYEEYDDMEMGALDHDDIEGFVPDNSEILSQVLSEFEESQKKLVLEKEPTESKDETNKDEDEESDIDEESEDDDKLVKMKFEERQKDTWDCESILSTYSNLYNHPKIIEDPPKEKKPTERTGTGTIKLSQKTGMPLGVLPVVGPTRKQLERQEIEEYRVPLMVQPRKKGQKETAEEKKERKQAIKSERRVRRMEKKANKEAFKEEEKVQRKVMMNLQTNLQGVKIT